MPDPWPLDPRTLALLQERIAAEAAAARTAHPLDPEGVTTVGGCFVAYARGEAGPGHAGDRAWAAAVSWRPSAAPDGRVADSSVVFDQVPAPYSPGLLARREGPILAAAVAALRVRPEVLLVDATGLDHPRRAGLAVHLGAVVGLPTVGVTHRPLVARGARPPTERGRRAPLVVDGTVAAMWVCTRSGARPIVAHAAWRTDADTAADIVLRASNERARTPLPLRAARHAARSARAAAGA